MRVSHILVAAASVAVLLSVIVLTLNSNERDAPSNLSIKMVHGDIPVRASSFAPIPGSSSSDIGDSELKKLQAIVSSITEEDARMVSDDIFEKSKFALLGSHNNGSSVSFSTRKLRSKSGDKQFFVQFSTHADVYTLAALHKFTNERVISHVHNNLFIAIGGDSFPAMARRFPGVVWVQERAGRDKIGDSLRRRLELLSQDSFITQIRRFLSPRSSVSTSNPVVVLIVQCWHDACGAAAQHVQTLCPDVYVHAELIEVLCATNQVDRAVSLLADHVGVEHIDVKQRIETKNFAGSAILGTGPLATGVSQSQVLSSIDVSNSVIGVADTGINMNNCYFYDSAASSPWTNSRVVKSYSFLPCTACGRCCRSGSPSGCTDLANACGNLLEEDGHGTHVSGTIAGNAGTSSPVSMGNGIATGARLFFQDIENKQPASRCFQAGACDGLYPGTQLSSLFQPAYDAGVRVHSNSWGCGGSTVTDPFACNTYSTDARNLDAFVSSRRDFLVLVAAGNDGSNSFSKTVGSPATCKNCLSVGATQLSDALFRGMKPMIDQGWHCQQGYSTSGCCSSTNGFGRTCVQSSETNSPCCAFTSATRMSLACCPTAFSSNVRHPYNVATFSSRGTTFDDGRIKPDLAVPGEDILSAFAPGVDSSGTMIPTTANYCTVPSPTSTRTITDADNAATRTMSGTSMATPLAAGAVEKIRQYFRQGYYPSGVKGSATAINPDESLLRAVILASARPLVDGGVWSGLPYSTGFFRFSPISSSNIPDIFGGFGMPILDNAVTMPQGTHKMFYTSEEFTTSSPASAFSIACTPSSSIPVTVVLAWTDPAGFTGSTQQLVNDLDLIVLVPGGSPSQLYGNMRQSADQSNNVERTICSCPASGSITAVVVRGGILTSQLWYLVANGPISQAITKMASVPAFNTGRITPPATTTSSCRTAARSTHTLYFLPGRIWSGSSWDMQLRYQEFCSALSTFARVNFQAVNISMLSATQGTATLSLGCSTLIASSAGSLSYVTAATLLTSIMSNCGVVNSVCTTDPVLSVFNWTAFSGGSTPPPLPPADTCASFSSCSTCTSASSCGWCPSLAVCKKGTSTSSDDGMCSSNLWVWLSNSCSGTPQPTPSPAPVVAIFSFRLRGFDFSRWTTEMTETFRRNIQNLLKDAASIVRIRNVRAGSVVIDSEVTVSSASQLSVTNSILTNPTVIQQVPEFGQSMSVVAVGSDTTCQAFSTSSTCIATSGCGWCSAVATCMPGTNAGATVPAGSMSTCSGSDWLFGQSCASIYLVGDVCLGLPAAALYAIFGVAAVHLVQALLYFFWARSNGFFTCGKFMFALLLPVFGWAVWCFWKQPNRHKLPESEGVRMETFRPPATSPYRHNAYPGQGPPVSYPPPAYQNAFPAQGPVAAYVPSAPAYEYSYERPSSAHIDGGTPRGKAVLNSELYQL